MKVRIALKRKRQYITFREGQTEVSNAQDEEDPILVFFYQDQSAPCAHDERQKQ
jgi:hypothetical protein